MFSALIAPVAGLLDKFIEDKDQKNALAHEINKAEAASASVFKGGWRPFIGWTCGFAFAYHFVMQPFLLFCVAMFGLDIPALPQFDMSSLMTVLMGMLGLGGLRTYEKKTGVSK